MEFRSQPRFVGHGKLPSRAENAKAKEIGTLKHMMAAVILYVCQKNNAQFVLEYIGTNPVGRLLVLVAIIYSEKVLCDDSGKAGSSATPKIVAVFKQVKLSRKSSVLEGVYHVQKERNP